MAGPTIFIDRNVSKFPIFNSILPAPSNVSDEWSQKDPWFRRQDQHKPATSNAIVSLVKEPPPYGRRKGFVPRLPQVNHHLIKKFTRSQIHNVLE